MCHFAIRDLTQLDASSLYSGHILTINCHCAVKLPSCSNYVTLGEFPLQLYEFLVKLNVSNLSSSGHRFAVFSDLSQSLSQTHVFDNLSLFNRRVIAD